MYEDLYGNHYETPEKSADEYADMYDDGNE
jgi:hypothetical protein